MHEHERADRPRRAPARSWAAIASAVAIASAGCAKPADEPPAATAGASTVDATTAVATELDHYFAAKFPADEPGGAIRIEKRGRVVLARGYGLADLTTRQPITTATLFNLGSITKTFVASAILILQAQGKLSVDDPLSTYFPGFKNPQIAAKVRIRHLLTHTSGLPDNREVAKDPTFYLTAKDAENWQPITQADALEFAPGARFEYSNPAFNGLALIIEKVSGMKWQTFVRDRILVPAGMRTSTITDGPHPESGVAHGYWKDGGPWQEADYGEMPTFAAAGNGGVWSSVDELAAYEHALHDGTFLAPAIVADAQRIKTFAEWTAKAPPEIGWSWFVGETPDHLRTVGHEGEQGGFRASYVTVPDKGIFFVILTNTPRDQEAFVQTVMQRLRDANWLD